MCGILAIVDPFGAPARAAGHAGRGDFLLDRLEHRGPDGRGTLTSARAWLGHRRLSIVDPSGGAQPFAAGGLAWVSNAEIFNHVDLRRRFGSASSRSDCSVIGPAWRALGDRVPAALDGQFAWVCIDQDSGRWIATRDHAGISPLYVGWHTDGTIWFASEMKALVDDCSRVEVLPPGHAWCSDERGLRLVKWYTPRWEYQTPRAAADLPRLRGDLIEAVSKRMMSDVPWGVLLSGGVDSSIVAAIATRLCREQGVEPPRSFAIGLEGGPDLTAARRVANFLGTRHHEFTFTIAEAMDAIPAAVTHLESYQQVRTAVPTMILARKVREAGVKMVLSGEGADELLGGYLYFHSAPSADEFHAETVRKTMRLHLYDVMRANKAPMAYGVELRFPFLDRDFIDTAMTIDPADRMVRADRRGRRGIEKEILRMAFDQPADPWLPPDVLWRQKEQFSDGVGYRWVDAVRAAAALQSSAEDLANVSSAFPEDPPVNAEMLWMRRLFDAAFVDGRTSGRSALATVGVGRSIACSTPEAVTWNPEWEALAGDISGRAITTVHAAGWSL
ncbi:MAG TPA: asparagine synthase B [Vicinamibacterales bacterium]|nr:asparagine synthase B [Vicinamibacterales bacterium]